MRPKFGLTPLEARAARHREVRHPDHVDADVRVGTDPDAVRASFAGGGDFVRYPTAKAGGLQLDSPRVPTSDQHLPLSRAN